MSDVTIRTFVESDQPQVAAMYKAGESAYIDTPVVGQCYYWFVNDKLQDGGDVANIQKFFMSDAGKTNFWVAELDGQLVGFVGACRSTRFDEDHVELVRMFVSPEVRKKAIGAKLLTAFEEWAHSVGYKHIYLTTLAGFPGANALYRKSGFELVEGVDIDVTTHIHATEPTTTTVNHYVKAL